MSVPLPSPVEAFFDASNAGDAALAASLFALDGEVGDERQSHQGAAAIADWARDTQARYQMQAAPFAASHDGDVHVVKAKVSGAFPGSPLDLTYRFHLNDGAIRKLEIG